MLTSLTAGAVLGLSAGFAPGPLLTLVITQTIKHDIKEGMKVALAPLITDLPIILVSLFVLARLTEFERILGAISIAGGLYVLFLSYECIQTGPVTLEVEDIQPQSLRRGSLVNALNPHPYLFWITVGSPLVLKFRVEGILSPLLFIGCFYVLLIGSKVFLAIVVDRSRAFLTSKGYIYVMRALGVALGIFAIFLFKDGLVFLGILT
jgi:threonine/homoserine/homoserine lactone efflux protein